MGLIIKAETGRYRSDRLARLGKLAGDGVEPRGPDILPDRHSTCASEGQRHTDRVFAKLDRNVPDAGNGPRLRIDHVLDRFDRRRARTRFALPAKEAEGFEYRPFDDARAERVVRLQFGP